MIEYNEQGHCWIAKEIPDLIGWRLIYVEVYKPGVVKLHVARYSHGYNVFRIVFAPVEIVPIKVIYPKKDRPNHV